MMEPFHQCLALGPVAIYLLLLGVINLARRPLVVSGGRDAAALGLAVSGLVFVGPMALLFPESVAAHFGPAGTKYLWLTFIGLLAICLIMVLLILRPRLIIYNISVDQLRPILAEVVERMDPEARWAGDCLFLPGLGVQLHLESFGWMRNVSLVSSGPKQDYQGWSRLGVELAAALRGIEVPWNLGGRDVAQRRQRLGPRAGLGHHSRSAGDRADGVRVAGYEMSHFFIADSAAGSCPAFGATRGPTDDFAIAHRFALLGVFPDSMNVIIEACRELFADCMDLGNNGVRTHRKSPLSLGVCISRAGHSPLRGKYVQSAFSTPDWRCACSSTSIGILYRSNGGNGNVKGCRRLAFSGNGTRSRRVC